MFAIHPSIHPCSFTHPSTSFYYQEAEEDYPAGEEEAADQGSSKNDYPTEECAEDGLEDLPTSISRRWKGRITREASQTSVYLQEWDIPYEQLQLGELIGKVRMEIQ